MERIKASSHTGGRFFFVRNKAKADQIYFWSAFVGSKGGIFGAIYSFLPIYLEVSISFRIFCFAEDRMHLGNIKNVYFFVFLSIFTIFANKKGGTGSTSPIILILLFVNCYPMC